MQITQINDAFDRKQLCFAIQAHLYFELDFQQAKNIN